MFGAAVVLVLGLATFVRFWHLTDQGFTGYDEGWLIDVAQRSAHEWRQGNLKSYSDFKSSHTTWALLTGTFLTFGVSSRSIQYPFALFGVLDVAALMCLARLLFDRRVALVAGLFLATSPFHTMYSRTVGIETPGILFVLLSCAITCAVARARRRSTLLVAATAAGVAAALGATANYRAVVCLPVPLLMFPFLTGSMRRLSIAAAGYLLGLALVFGSWDIALRIAYPETGGYFRAMLHSDESRIAYAFRGVDSVLQRFRIAQPAFYVRALWDLGNASLLVLAGLGAVFLLVGGLMRAAGYGKAVGGSDVLLLVALFVPALGLTAIEYKAPRAFSIVEPFVVLLAARAMALLWRAAAGLPRLRAPLRLAAAIGVVLPVAMGIAETMREDVVGRSNGFRRVFTEVGDRSDGVVVVLDRYVPEFYARETGRKYSVIGMGATLGDLVTKAKTGHRYLALDGQFAVFQNYLALVWPVLDPLEPSLLIPAPNYIRLAHFLEHAMHLSTSYDREADRYRWWTQRWGRNLPVYDLHTVVRALDWEGAGSRWYRVGTGIVAMKAHDKPSAEPDIVVDARTSATRLRTRLLFDFNRLPIQGGIGLVRDVGSTWDGVAFYWRLGRQDSEGSLDRLSGQVLQPIAKTTRLRIMPETEVTLQWTDDAVEVRLDGAPLLRADVPAGPGALHPALLADAADSLELRELVVETH